MNNSSNLPPSTCTCHLPNQVGGEQHQTEKVKKDIQWMSFDSGAEKSTLAVDRLQSLFQKSLTLKCHIKTIDATLQHCNIHW